MLTFKGHLAISDVAEFDGLIDELDDCFLTVTRQKKEQLKSKVRKKMGYVQMKCFYKELDRRKKYLNYQNCIMRWLLLEIAGLGMR